MRTGYPYDETGTIGTPISLEMILQAGQAWQVLIFVRF